MSRPPAMPDFRQMFPMDQGEAKPHIFPMKEAQHEMLRHAVERSQISGRDFQRGDAVHFGPGLGQFTADTKARMVFIFWRWLDLDTTDDKRRLIEGLGDALIAMPNVDCLIAFYSGENAVRFHIASSCLLLPGDE